MTDIPDPHVRPADLDVVIVNYRTPMLLQRCLESWEKFSPERDGIRTNIIVVDVAPDGLVFNPNNATLLRTPQNVGFGGACNRAALLCRAPIISFWNADTALTNDTAIPRMIAHFAEVPECGIAGPKSVNADGLLTHAGIFGNHANPEQRGWLQPDSDAFSDVRRCVSVSGSAYFVRRTAWDKLSECDLYRDRIAPAALGAFLDTPHYFEETWISYHAFAHREQVWYVGDATVLHHWNKAPKPEGGERELFARSQPIFRRACQMHGIEHN